MSAFFELDNPGTMSADAAATVQRLPLVAPRLAYTDVYAEYPTDQPKPTIEISDAAARLANALHLHLD